MSRFFNDARLGLPIKYMLTFGFGGATIFLGTLYYVRKIIYEDIFENGPLAYEARSAFYRNTTAKAILGTPITEQHVDTWNPRINLDNDYERRINLPVQGTKMKGHIHFEGVKNLKTGDWVLTAVSLKSEDLERTLYSIIPPEE